jgi:queuine tRNA-ribosyltransferase
MKSQLQSRNKDYRLPIFLTDATFGVVKALDSKDIENSGIRGIVVNTYHLLNEPTSKVVEGYGGIKKFMNFEGLVVTDSGGWQIFSLIHRNKKAGKIKEDGVVFSYGKLKGKLFTPEDCIQTQFEIGSDIIICLDDFTPPNVSEQKILDTVERTVRWAKRCKVKYEELCEKYGYTKENRPLLFAVVQGGDKISLRKYCIDKLLEIGFDGYGFGGYMIDEDGNLDLEISEKLAALIPDEFFKFALGVGDPAQVIKCLEYGWEIFDCTLPTRDARHKRLYVFNEKINSFDDLKKENFFKYIYLGKEKYLNSTEKICDFCECYTCQNYSLGYLNYLFKIKSVSAQRLASIHNLHFYSTIFENYTKNKKQD